MEISAAQLDQRVDNFLIKRLGNVPRTRIYRLIRKGEVRVNKKRCKPEYKLQIGDLVRIPPMLHDDGKETRQQPPPRLLNELKRAVLFQNPHMLVIDKPAKLAVHAGSSVAWGVIDAMRLLYPQDDIELVHRLDRDTSGCLLFARHRQSLLALQEMLRDNRLCKRYYALVKGTWPEHEHEVNLPLKKYRLPNNERRVAVAEDGKPALSRVRVQQAGRQYSIIQVELVTGRTHQIRVHCQALGHEIAGDNKYGDPRFNREMRKQGVRRLMLHAASLEFPHSDYTPEIVINAPLPLLFEKMTNPQ